MEIKIFAKTSHQQKLLNFWNDASLECSIEKFHCGGPAAFTARGIRSNTAILASSRLIILFMRICPPRRQWSVNFTFHQRPGPRIPLGGALLMSPLAGPGRHRHFSFFSLIPLFIPLPFFPFLYSSVISDKGASLNVGKIWIESKKKKMKMNLVLPIKISTMMNYEIWKSEGFWFNEKYKCTCEERQYWKEKFYIWKRKYMYIYIVSFEIWKWRIFRERRILYIEKTIWKICMEYGNW